MPMSRSGWEMMVGSEKPKEPKKEEPKKPDKPKDKLPGFMGKKMQDLMDALGGKKK